MLARAPTEGELVGPLLAFVLLSNVVRLPVLPSVCEKILSLSATNEAATGLGLATCVACVVVCIVGVCGDLERPGLFLRAAVCVGGCIERVGAGELRDCVVVCVVGP